MKKHKIIYHRLAIVVVAGILVLSIVGMSVIKLVGWILPKDDKVSEKTQAEKPKEKTPKDTVKEEKHVVVIDAGHGGYDDGSVSANGILEKQVTLDVALELGAQLEKNKDVKVLYTREDDDWYWTYDNAEDLYARSNVAVDHNADLFISLHMNDTEEGADIRGFDVWVCMTSNENITFAQNVEAALSSLGYTSSRGIQDEANSPLQVLRYNTSPSVLVEMGFMSNESDLAYVTSTEGKKALAKALADAMLKTLEENGK